MDSKTKEYIFENEPSITIDLSSNIKILVVNNLKDFKKFYSVPWEVYKGDKYWVPPFWKESRDFFKIKNLFWRHSQVRLYLAFKNGKLVGRIAGIIDNNLPKENGKKIGYFGFFESIKNSSVALGLLNCVKDWLKSKKISIMRGPINGRIDLTSGFLLEGFNKSPYLFTAYTPKYYLKFAEDFDFKKSTDLLTYFIDFEKPIPKLLKQKAKKSMEKGVKVRHFNRLFYNKEINIWLEMFQEVFTHHWGYAPASFEEIRTRFGVKELKWIINPRLFLFAEINDEIAGFRLAMPNYNQIFKKLNGKLNFLQIFKFLINYKNIDQGKFVVLGTKEKYRGLGVGTCLNYHAMLEMKKLGYKQAEYGWIEENNIPSIKAGKRMGGILYKKYRVFEKKI